MYPSHGTLYKNVFGFNNDENCLGGENFLITNLLLAENSICLPFD
jgi:hypothetical protein